MLCRRIRSDGGQWVVLALMSFAKSRFGRQVIYAVVRSGLRGLA